MRIFLGLVFLFIILTNPQLCSIVGTTHGRYENVSKLDLYKFNNVYDQEFIKHIEVSNSHFFFQKSLEEKDVYMITNPNDNKFFIFVWDGDVTIDIDSAEFDKSKIINSPLTSQKSAFETMRTRLFLKPIWDIDSILQLNKINETLSHSQIDSLKDRKNKLFDNGRLGFKKFTIDYISKNPDSFLSLYLLTLKGTEASDEENIKLFNCLSDSLKMHSRAKIYRNN